MPTQLRLVPVMANGLLALAGLAAIMWGLTVGGSPAVTCHGIPMRPGDVCHRLEIDGSDKGKQQTYEAAVRQKRQAQPVIVAMGVLVAGFAGALLAMELRRGGRPGGPTAAEDTPLA